MSNSFSGKAGKEEAVSAIAECNFTGENGKVLVKASEDLVDALSWATCNLKLCGNVPNGEGLLKNQMKRLKAFMRPS